MLSAEEATSHDPSESRALRQCRRAARGRPGVLAGPGAGARRARPARPAGAGRARRRGWASSLMLPGFRFCRVDVELGNLNCWTERLPPPDAETRTADLKRSVGACSAGLVPSEDVERASTAVRSKTTWGLPVGRRARLVKRTRTGGP